MALEDITKKTTTDEVKEDAHVLITQTETVEGAQKSALRRLPYAKLLEPIEEELEGLKDYIDAGDKTDTTLKVSGMAADSKVVGDEIDGLKEDLGDYEDDLGEIESLTTDDKECVVSAINELAGVVYDQTYTEQEKESIYPRRSEDVQLSIGTSSFVEASAAYGFYLPVTDLRGKKIIVQRDNFGARFRLVFSADEPAVGVTYNSDYRMAVDSELKYMVTRVPDDVNYLYVMYYSSTYDTITKEQALQGIKIVEAVDCNLFDVASEDKTFALNQEIFAEGSTLVGLYTKIPAGAFSVTLKRNLVGERFRICFSVDEPAIGTTHDATEILDGVKETTRNIPSGAKYVYWGYYNPEVDTYTREQLRDGMQIIPIGPASIRIYNNADRLEGKVSKNQGVENVGKALVIDEEGEVVPGDVSVVVDPTLSHAGEAADAKNVGDILYTPYTENLYLQRSQRIQLGFNSGVYNQATTLYGFYVPIDPTKGTTVTIQRIATGTRFRVAAGADEPAVGVSYHDRVDKDSGGNTIEFSDILSTDRYLYIAYYSTNDTLTEDELLAGFKIFYGTKYEARENRVELLSYQRDVQFVNGNIGSTGLFESDSKHIVSDYISVNGTFGVSCPDDYQMTVHLYDSDNTYITSKTISDAVQYITHFGMIRVCIADAELSDVTPGTVDFSEIKMPYNRYSPKAYTTEQTTVLDAENCLCDDVFAYLDIIVAPHEMYATKTYLCTEESGLPIYYYTLGNGSKKLCIVSGQHGPGSSGDPRDSVITVAKFMHDLIDGSFSDSSFMKELHDNYTILVIPILNVYGFNNRSRTNADGDDTNRDWSSPSTIEVTAAKTLIASFNPDIAFDVHCNGTTPIVNADIEIQFGLGETHNPLYKDAIQAYFKSYYDTDVATRLPNSTDTLQYYIQNTLGIMGGLLELRWWVKSKKWMHDYQAESANYAMLLNVIKYCASVTDGGTYSYEHTPNQLQY